MDRATDLPALPALPPRSSTAEAAAGLLRDQIAHGRIRPGAQLREEQVAAALAISRNTVREAFRLLSHERLVEHALHRGVFVREVSVDDVRAMYLTRRLVIPLAVDACLADPAAVERLAEVVGRGEAAAARHDWEGVGTADIDFHRTLMGACGSSHLTTMYARLLAELRLAFLQMDGTRVLHEPFLARNRYLVQLLRAGDRAAALAEVEDYLRTAEATVVEALTTAS